MTGSNLHPGIDKERHVTMPTALRRNASLDWLNFFLADVRDGLGPYLAIYLLTVQHWDEAGIGLVMTVGGLAGIVAQTPAGAWIDRTHAKRGTVIAAAIAITAGSMALPFAGSVAAVVAVQVVSGVAGAIFPPAIAAITLGLVGPRAFARRTGRNEAFNHAGNAVAALLAGAAAYFWGPLAIFVLMAVMTVASIAAAAALPAAAIDHEVARGLEPDGPPGAHPRSGFAVLTRNRPLAIFAICVVLFHVANAAMLPLVGQKLSRVDPQLGTSFMSACIIAAQFVMVPVALVVGAKADTWGRKPIFMAGFLVLAIRGALYGISDSPAWLIGVQALDGVGAGIFGALFPLVVADLTRGSGRFNLAQGAIATATGIGAAVSTSIAGLIVVSAGYGAAFLSLALIAGVGLGTMWLAMPETRIPEAAARPAAPVPTGDRNAPAALAASDRLE